MNASLLKSLRSSVRPPHYPCNLIFAGRIVAPSAILFVTDNVNEAIAARAAGLQCALSVRPGTAPLPVGHGFPVITDFTQLATHVNIVPHHNE